MISTSNVFEDIIDRVKIRKAARGRKTKDLVNEIASRLDGLQETLPGYIEQDELGVLSNVSDMVEKICSRLILLGSKVRFVETTVTTIEEARRTLNSVSFRKIEEEEKYYFGYITGTNRSLLKISRAVEDKEPPDEVQASLLELRDATRNAEDYYIQARDTIEYMEKDEDAELQIRRVVKKYDKKAYPNVRTVLFESSQETQDHATEEKTSIELESALHDAERRMLVHLLVQKAVGHPDTPQIYFTALVQHANVPPVWQGEVVSALGGDVSTAALKLVQWADSKGSPNENNKTTLGGFILDAWLPRLDVREQKRIRALRKEYERRRGMSKA